MSRTRLSTLLAIPLLAASLLVGATPAIARGTLDQGAPSGGGSVTPGGSNRSIGQSFTAGLTGLLDTVSVVPASDLSGATVEIRAAMGGLPTGPALATATITSSAAGVFVDVAFAAPAAVVARKQYAIVVRPRTAPGLHTSAGDYSYIYGSGFVNSPLSPGTFEGVVVDGEFVDFAFRTYVTDYGFAWKSPTKGKGNGVNKPHAGTNVEVWFRLDRGISAESVLAAGWPKVRRVDCSTKVPIPGTQWMTRPFGAKGIWQEYETGYWIYLWRVRAEWGNGPLACREFRIKLTDGTTHSALYRFQPAD